MGKATSGIVDGAAILVGNQGLMEENAVPLADLVAQAEQLASSGVEVGDRDRAAALLKAVGYYRLTG